MRHLKLFSLILVLSILGSLPALGEDEVYKTAEFTSGSFSKGVSGYTGTEFTSTTNGFVVTLTNCNNNNKGWDYVKIGGKNGAYTGTIVTNTAIDKAVTKVNLTINAITASNVTSITLYSSTDNSSWTSEGTFTKSIGTKTVTIASPAANKYYKITAVCTKGSSNGLLTISKVEYYKEKSVDPGTCAAPTFTPDGGNFIGTTTVTLSSTTSGATIYYTMGNNPSDPTTSSTQYTSAGISVTETTTIKAIAVKSGMTNSSVVSKTFTKATILTVAQARDAIDAGGDLTNKYVAGTISQIDSYNSTYKSLQYWISDDGTTTDQLEVYSGKGLNGADFSAVTDLNVGDDVTVIGTLKKYNSTYEFDKNNYIVARKPIARLAWNGTTAGEFAASLEGGNTFPTLSNLDNVSVSYSSSETSYASFTDASDYATLTLNAVGSTTITATFTGNENFKANSASYILNVESSVIKADILFEENGGSTVPDLTAQSNLPSPLPTTTKAGYNFGGWFTTSTFEAGSEAVAGAAVTSSDPITLYAKWLDPYSVGVALTMINALADNEKTDNVYVIGVVDSHATSLSGTSINYNIKDANASNTLAVYKGKGLKTDLAPAGEDVTSADYVQEGDQIVVYGQLYKYVKNSTTTPEIAQGSYMYSKVRPTVAVTGVDLTEATAEVEVGSSVTLHASVVPGNATNKTINWTVESGSDKASVQDGVVSGLAAGTAVIRAASDEDATIYAECTVTVTAADPTKHVVTFDATVDTEIFTKDNITMSCSNGALSNGSEYRLYKNSETTFECSVGNITKIEFTGVSGNPVSGFEDPAEGTLETSGNDGVWTGNVASVTFTASGAQVRASLIKVTYKEDTRAESGLAWDPATDIELTVGDPFTPRTLSNPNSIDAAEITIESSNTSLATVSTGVVSLVANATGEATITATFAGNDDYKPATVSYKITVNGGALTDYYEKVTSGAVAEGTYLIVYETTSVAFDGSLETLDATSNTIDVTITNDHKIAVTQATTASTFYIDPTAGTIKSASGKYIGRTANSNGMNTSATEAYTNTISIDNDGNAVIVGSGTTATYLRYNPSSGQTRFRYFTQNQQAIQLYKLANEVIKPAAGLAWDPADDIELTVGDAFTPRTLLNPNNIAASEISITSSNTNLATVNNGVVELVADATGTTTIKATFAGNDDYKAAEVSYKIKVNPLSSIAVTPSLKVNFGFVEQGATLPDNQAIIVTLTNVAAATATLGGTNPEAFGIDKTALVEGDNVINISVASTATAGDFKATIVITDNATENPAASKTVNISLKVTEPAAEETPVSTTSNWVAATAADLVDGKEVLITGAKEGTIYAMGEQKTSNRAAVAGTLDEGVFTPGENTMSVTLVDQGNNTFALMTSDGQYLYAASNSSNHLKTEDALDAKNNGLWTITYENNEWSIVAQGENGHNIMRFNENNSIFSCYASGQSPVQLYKKAPIAPKVVDVTGSEAASDIPEGSEVTVEDGGELVVNTTNSFAKLIVKKGGKVTLSNKKLTVTGTFAIETSMGSGKSGELSGVSGSNFAVTGEAYIDITLGDNGNADKWHAFTVPFPVDALNGIFDLNGNKLTNETNYAIMDYHGDIRAQGKYGWKKFRGTLVPGTFYLMTVDGLRTTYRMKMKAGSTIVAGNSKAVTAYSGAGATTDKGWNGIGNPTLAYGKVNAIVQVLNPESYTYETKGANSCNFIVGTPFFYQAVANGSIEMQSANASAYYAPIRKAVKTTEQIKVSLANENYTDNLFISASEDATADYQVGKDLVKMTMTNTPIVPQIFGVAYKTQLSMVHAPLVGDRATYTLNLYAPADGEYTISAQQTEDAIIYLTYEGSPIWNITAGEYNCDLQKGNNSGFGLMLVRRAPQVTTDIEGANQSQTGVRKLLINGQLFIEKDGKLFNVTGERL